MPSHDHSARRRIGPNLRMVVKPRFGLAPLALAFILSCGDSPTEPAPPSPPPPDAPRPTSISIAPASVTFLALGDTARLTAEVRDQNQGPIPGATVTWTSSNEAIATVSASGLASGVGNGEAAITGSAGPSVSGTAAVTVSQVTRTVSVAPAVDTLVTGDTLRLSAEALDANGHTVVGAEFSWSSEAPAVAAVDSAGLVTAANVGATVISAVSGDATGRAELVVVAPVPTVINVTPGMVALGALGDTARLAAEVLDQSGRVIEDATVSWLSADESIATVDSLGLVAAEGPGVTTVNATSGSASDTAAVSVMQITGSIVVSPPADTIAPGDTVRLVAEARDANGHIVASAEFSWSSSDAAVAEVDDSGLVRGAGEGTATITASAGSVRGTAAITVVNPDRAALVALYGATNGQNWRRTDRWLTEAPLGDWYGVATNAAGRVTRLNLRSNALNGPIPPELGSLASVERLELSGNLLSGSIPQSLLDIETFASLRFGDNAGLCAPGTSAFVTWLRRIEEHDGPYCNEPDAHVLDALYRTTGGPDWTNTTGWLQTAALDEWYGVTADSLGRVVTLDLTRNGLVGQLPSDLGALTAMTRLLIGGNALSGPLPRALARLPLVDFHYASTELCAPVDAEFQAWLDGIPSHEGTGVDCVPVSDRETLVALYNATGGPNWNNNRNWLTDAPLGEWRGVGTDNEGRVTHLRLRDNAMSGPIPPDIGNLSYLEWLDVSDNRLSGPIPTELGDLVRLEWLQLSDNHLFGPIPSGLSNLAALGALWLHGNSLSGPIPPELGNLVRLERLDLSNNRLSGSIPLQLGNLTRLTIVRLGENSLTGPIPTELGNLSDLRTLWLDYNGLSGPIPAELGNLVHLTDLNLWVNNLSGLIPPELGNLTNLTDLRLSWNALSGPIPPELGNLTNLTGLRLSRTNLSGPIPPELGNLMNLRSVRIDHNRLSGPIPPRLLRLQELTGFFFHDNAGLCAPGRSVFATWLENIDKHEGVYCNESDISILDGLYQMTGGAGWTNTRGWLQTPVLDEWHGVTSDSLGRVVTLDLTSNGLAGALPHDLGALAQMTRLRIGRNDLSGPLPLALARLPLVEFDYDRTELCAPTDSRFQAWLLGLPSLQGTGVDCPPLSDRDALIALYHATATPNWNNSLNWLTDAPLGEWHGVGTDDNGRVTHLSLRGNGLVGPIPTELGSLVHLEQLDLFDNNLSGPIPAELGNLANLTSMGLARNHLSGPVPPELGTLSALERLWLYDNNLSGSIPPQLGSLANLEILMLRQNSLSGPIPPELGDLAKLRVLSLEWNDLSGLIPRTLSDITNLIDLSLNVNALSGPIPLEFGRLSNLSRLDLSGNSLTGPIPPELGNLASLEELDFGGNRLSGPIPPELGDLTDLRNLGLGSNSLSGPIPPELGNLADLEKLNLWGNHLSGPIPPELGNLANLEWAYLANNNFVGPIPPQLGNLVKLDRLVIANNRLSGPIPPQLGGLPNLVTLALHQNSLSGPVPAELGNLANVARLTLSGNALTGSVPHELLRLERLRTFVFGDNHGLCLPNTAAFVEWLKGIEEHSGPFCSESDSVTPRFRSR